MPLPPPPPPPPAPPSPESSAERDHPTLRGPDRALAIAIGVLLTVSCFAAVVRIGSGSSDPGSWDPRVADLAAFVERARGLSFDHPVRVDFLSPAAYTAAVTTDGEDLGEEERAELDVQAAQLRALGVASGDVDLVAAFNQVSDAGTLAFYNPDDESVRVRGTDLSVGLRVTLVHELTHALQDQHFGLADLLGDADDTSESDARRALAEGDATRVEVAYVDEELSDEERVAYEEEYQAEVDQSVAGTADVPDFLNATFGVPYALGPPFVAMLLDAGGNEGVDDAFRDPPSTEEHLFDPASYLAGEKGKAPDLDLEDLDDAFEEGPLGPPRWFLILAQRIDANTAFEAALGWGGDAYGTYTKGGRSCVRAVFRGDTETDETEMGEVIDAWAAAMPGGKAKRIDVDGHPGLDACDPGTAVDIPLAESSGDLLVLPNTWGYLEAETARGLGPEGSRCFARALLADIPYARLIDPAQQDALSAELETRAARSYSECESVDR